MRESATAETSAEIILKGMIDDEKKLQVGCLTRRALALDILMKTLTTAVSEMNPRSDPATRLRTKVSSVNLERHRVQGDALKLTGRMIDTSSIKAGDLPTLYQKPKTSMDMTDFNAEALCPTSLPGGKLRMAQGELAKARGNLIDAQFKSLNAMYRLSKGDVEAATLEALSAVDELRCDNQKKLSAAASKMVSRAANEAMTFIEETASTTRENLSRSLTWGEIYCGKQGHLGNIVAEIELGTLTKSFRSVVEALQLHGGHAVQSAAEEARSLDSALTLLKEATAAKSKAANSKDPSVLAMTNGQIALSKAEIEMDETTNVMRKAAQMAYLDSTRKIRMSVHNDKFAIKGMAPRSLALNVAITTVNKMESQLHKAKMASKLHLASEAESFALTRVKSLVSKLSETAEKVKALKGLKDPKAQYAQMELSNLKREVKFAKGIAERAKADKVATGVMVNAMQDGAGGSEALTGARNEMKKLEDSKVKLASVTADERAALVEDAMAAAKEWDKHSTRIVNAGGKFLWKKILKKREQALTSALKNDNNKLVATMSKYKQIKSLSEGNINKLRDVLEKEALVAADMRRKEGLMTGLIAEKKKPPPSLKKKLAMDEEKKKVLEAKAVAIKASLPKVQTLTLSPNSDTPNTHETLNPTLFFFRSRQRKRPHLSQKSQK